MISAQGSGGGGRAPMPAESKRLCGPRGALAHTHKARHRREQVLQNYDTTGCVVVCPDAGETCGVARRAMKHTSGRRGAAESEVGSELRWSCTVKTLHSSHGILQLHRDTGAVPPLPPPFPNQFSAVYCAMASRRLCSHSFMNDTGSSGWASRRASLISLNKEGMLFSRKYDSRCPLDGGALLELGLSTRGEPEVSETVAASAPIAEC